MAREELVHSNGKTDVVSVTFLMMVIELHKKFADSDNQPAEQILFILFLEMGCRRALKIMKFSVKSTCLFLMTLSTAEIIQRQ
jgi:hypothetical protein